MTPLPELERARIGQHLLEAVLDVHRLEALGHSCLAAVRRRDARFWAAILRRPPPPPA